MVSWDVLWGVWGKLGVHRASRGLPEGLLVDLGSPLRSSVRPWVVFEGQLDTLFRLTVSLRTRLRAFGKSTCRLHGKLIFEAVRFNLGGKTPPGAIYGTVLGFFHRKKASTDSEIALGEALASRWMAATSKMSFPCTWHVDFQKSQRSRWK